MVISSMLNPLVNRLIPERRIGLPWWGNILDAIGMAHRNAATTDDILPKMFKFEPVFGGLASWRESRGCTCNRITAGTANMARPKITRDGKTYYTVGAAAKLLRTNALKVKQLMGDGSLEWSNLRVNGPLYISEASILAYQRKQLERKRAAAKGNHAE